MAEYESGSVTESSDEEEGQLFVPRKKVSKVQETIYNKDCREFVDDIVSGEELGSDEFSVCFIFCVDSRLAAGELVTATKDGSFGQKLAVVIRHFVDEIGLQRHCPSIEFQSCVNQSDQERLFAYFDAIGKWECKLV